MVVEVEEWWRNGWSWPKVLVLGFIPWPLPFTISRPVLPLLCCVITGVSFRLSENSLSHLTNETSIWFLSEMTSCHMWRGGKLSTRARFLFCPPHLHVGSHLGDDRDLSLSTLHEERTMWSTHYTPGYYTKHFACFAPSAFGVTSWQSWDAGATITPILQVKLRYKEVDDLIHSLLVVEPVLKMRSAWPFHHPTGLQC